MISGKLHLHAIALDPVHHGGDGTQGNKEPIRTQTIADPETGQPVDVPFISGNSVKHMIRKYGALFALQAAGLDDGQWTKAQRDLLLSGGTFSSGGSSVKLDAARKLERAFPILAVCGYAAGNYGAESKLDVDHWHLVCEENQWRLHDRIARLADEDSTDGNRVAGALKARAPQYKDVDFGTRHEPGSSEAMKMLTDDEQKRIADQRAGRQGDDHPDKNDSLQMIYDYEVLVPGTQFFSCIHFRNLSELERAAFTGALHHACQDTTADDRQVYRIGGKSSVGLGRVAVRWFGSIREDIRPPEHVDDDSLVAFGEDDSQMQRYVEHLREHESDIREAMEGLL